MQEIQHRKDTEERRWGICGCLESRLIPKLRLLSSPSPPVSPLPTCVPPPLLSSPSPPVSPLPTCVPPPLLSSPSPPVSPLPTCVPPPLLSSPSPPCFLRGTSLPAPVELQTCANQQQFHSIQKHLQDLFPRA
uniref:Uncharacterized protein n=1 Tax=Knipowitschia caucasica TaxID=637954 RepID=A0AAV2J711_KNICA